MAEELGSGLEKISGDQRWSSMVAMIGIWRDHGRVAVEDDFHGLLADCLN